MKLIYTIKCFLRSLAEVPHDVPRYICTDERGSWYAVEGEAQAMCVSMGQLPPLPWWWTDKKRGLYSEYDTLTRKIRKWE